MPLVTIDDLSHPDADKYVAEAERIYSWYQEHLEQGQENPNDRAPGIHASEISGCQRRMVYSIRGIEKRGKTEPRMKKIFELGHLVHDMLQKDFGKMANGKKGKLTFKKEVPIDPFSNPVGKQWQVYSSCDGVFTFWEFNEEGYWAPYLRVAIEIKSMAPDEFKALVKPKEDHIEQAHLYMACLDVPLTWFVYLNKSNLNMTLSGGRFMTKFNPVLWDKLERRFEQGHEHVRLKTLPDREEGMPCEWCPYAWTCDPEYLKKKAERGKYANPGFASLPTRNK
jgi:CRISPR/Cas system-associated exonuclease Cas4 (RecB family)